MKKTFYITFKYTVDIAPETMMTVNENKMTSQEIIQELAYEVNYDFWFYLCGDDVCMDEAEIYDFKESDDDLLN